MVDILAVLEWAATEGEVKSVDRILIKVMLPMIKAKVTLTASAIDKMENSPEVPDELGSAILKAAESVVGKPYTAKGEVNV